ncbi:MAG: glycosyltransferase [Alphaproteobacteria bacterium]
MTNHSRIKVAALIDLMRLPQSGGHVKGWEHLAHAAARTDLPLDLTVYFSGAESTEILSPHVRIRQLPPVFSTARLKFLPYIPDHTDLAPYHPGLARELANCDVVHTTDAFFAFTRTAERLHRQGRIAMTHAFHTDQASYARIFTAKAIRDIFPRWVQNILIDRWQLPERKEKQMLRRLSRHLRQCAEVLAIRPYDLALAEQAVGAAHTRTVRLGVDKTMFNPGRADRPDMLARYAIPPDRCIVLFVGRLDEGKNIYTLLDALKNLIDSGLPLHLVAAGVGPAADDIRRTLPQHATVTGFIPQSVLAPLYASADVLAMVSEVEIKSMAMIESLVSGLPVLVAAKSGVDKLFPPSPAFKTITGGSAAWIDALRNFTTQDRAAMQKAARIYGTSHIADWSEVLRADLFPAWHAALAQKNS